MDVSLFANLPMIILIACLALLAYLVVVVLRLRYCALCKPGEKNALQHLQGLRLSKMDKECVMVISLQKSGSTLLCYTCALLNTNGAIAKFRNDFDVLPMLSFPAFLIPQNFNARQDGQYQLYKINGHLKDIDQQLAHTEGVRRVVWMCREFSGYYRSVYWWIKQFYPRASRQFALFRFVPWKLYKALTLRLLARDHIDELWYVYKQATSPGPRNALFLSYEHLTQEKDATLRMLAAWLELEPGDDVIRSIVAKTSKTAMAAGDRFDPIRYGEGGGLSKVNLVAHKHVLSESDKQLYDTLFAKKFAGEGIRSYQELIEKIRGAQRTAMRQPAAG